MEKKTCGFCAQQLCDKTALKNHLRTHTEEKPFVCEICNKCFTQKHNLVAHHKAQHEQKTVCCQHCALSFKYPRNVQRHIQMEHHHADKIKTQVYGGCRRNGRSRLFCGQ